MDDDKTREARELHRTLEFIGLRAQATTVGLLQLSSELVKAGVLDGEAISRIKGAIHREIIVSHPRGHFREEFEQMLQQRLDAIFPNPSAAEDMAKVGTVKDMKTALDPNSKSGLSE